MYDAIGDENVGDDDLCGVHKDGAVFDGYGEGGAVYGFYGGVGEETAVADGARDHVVG